MTDFLQKFLGFQKYNPARTLMSKCHIDYCTCYVLLFKRGVIWFNITLKVISVILWRCLLVVDEEFVRFRNERRMYLTNVRQTYDQVSRIIWLCLVAQFISTNAWMGECQYVNIIVVSWLAQSERQSRAKVVCEEKAELWQDGKAANVLEYYSTA